MPTADLPKVRQSRHGGTLASALRKAQCGQFVQHKQAEQNYLFLNCCQVSYNLEIMAGFEFHENDDEAAIEKTLRRSTEMTERYGRELPPPDPDLAVVTVIPAYNELDNDNFWRMVRSASTQNAAKSNFEILYVVNEKETRFSRIKDAVKPGENLRTVRILRALQECERAVRTSEGVIISSEKLNSLGLSDWEQAVFRGAVGQGVSIHPLFFKYGQEGDGVSRKFFPQGMARDVGAAIALGRLNVVSKLDEGIIDFADADCFFPPDYFSQLQKHAVDPYVQKILIPVNPDIPEGIQKIKDPSWQLPQIIKYLRFSFIKARYRYLVADTNINSGPALAIQAKTFAKIGDYPSTTSMFSSEDFEFAKKVRVVAQRNNSETKQGESSPVMLYLSQRQTDASTDGATYAELARDQRPSNLEDEYQAIRTNQFFERLTNLSEMLNDALEQDKIASGDPRYISLRAQWFKRENIRRRASIRIIKGILEKLGGEFNSPDDLSKLNPRQKDYLESQPAILKSLSEIFRLVKRAKQNTTRANFYFGKLPTVDLSINELAIKFLQRFLPEYFSDPNESEPNYAKLRVFVNRPQESEFHDLGWFSHLTLALAEYTQYPGSKIAVKT